MPKKLQLLFEANLLRLTLCKLLKDKLFNEVSNDRNGKITFETLPQASNT